MNSLSSRTSPPAERIPGTAPANLVNRTHRVVRERAVALEQRRNRVRSLWIPLTVSFGLLATVLVALWSVMDESELLPAGIPDASQQMLLLLAWCLPLSAILLAVVWYRRGTRAGNEGSR